MKRILSILALSLLALIKADAHNVQYYTTCGYVCAGSNMTVDAQIANAGSSTRYAWQYRDNSGTWKCFVNGSNTINGTSFTVSGATANGVANDAPLLTIQSATTALENVQVRVLMTDGGDPCATSPSYAVWGGDADPDNKYMSLRLHVLSGSDCSTISTYCAQGGCNGNTMNDANGYYGGFESSNNWSSASTSYTEGGSSAGQYKVLNNVKSVQSSYPAFAPRSGNYMLYVNGSTTTNTKVWYKSVSVTAGSTYQFSAWIANANNASTNLPYIQLLVNGTLVATGTVTSIAGDWDFVQGTYDATTTGTVTIQIVDANIQSGNNDFVLDDICFKSLGATALTCGSGYFNPFGPAEGFNVFVKNGINFQQGHTDAGVAMGGDATMNGNVNLALLQTGAYPYGAGNANNYGIVIGGKMVYTSGQQSTVNNGFFRLGSTTNSRLFYQDCNNNNTNFKVTPYNADCNTAFNSQPQLALQQQQTTGSATDPHGLDFTTAFTSFQNYANYMAQYSASSSCSNNLNIISLGSGSQSITLVDNKVNVVNLTTAQFNAITSLTFNNAPSGTKPLVFNIDGTASFTWNPFNVGGLSNSAGAYIIYNFYNNSGTINLTGGNQVFGTIFCPGAAFQKNHSGNTEGQIVASSFVLNGGEVHYQPFNVCLPLCTATCTKTNETVPNQFNTGFSAPLSNSTFTGSTGTWTVNSNAQATAVCVQPYYSPSSSYAIKITNWNTSGKSAGSVSVASPKVDLTNACCPTELTFNFTLWTYTCVSGDANAALEIDFSSDNGSNWTEVWSKTSAQLYTLYGANGKTAISISVPTGYQTANFRYRFRGEMAANNPNNFYQFIDDIYVSSPTNCTVPNLTLGNLVWFDSDNDGIKDANEQGLSGFTVKLYKDSNGDNVPDGAAVATTTTNSNGEYSFTGLTADKYIVAVVMQTGYTVGTTISSSSNPNNDTDNDNNGITLTSGEVRSNFITLTNGGEPTGGTTNNTLDFGLKGTGSIGDYTWADYNGDGIQTAGEPVLEGIVVTLTYPDGTTKSTTTNASGNYLFSNLGPGTYNVNFVSPTGATPSPANQGSDQTKDSDPVGDNVTVELTAGQNRTDIDAGFVCCLETLSLGELLWKDTNGDGIKDAGEAGYAGATVKLYKDDNGDNVPDGAAIATTTTNSTGIYNFSNLTAGKYIVGITIPSGYMASSTTGTSATPNNNIATDNNGVNVVSGELRSNYITLTSSNFTLNFAIRTTGTGAGSISDYVWNDLDKDGIQDAGEPPIANATVTLTYPNSTVVSTTTNANGYYIFNNLSAGTYTVTFTTPAGMTRTLSNQGSDDTKDSDPVNGTISVTLTSNQNRTDIDAGFYVTGVTASSCGAGYATMNTSLVVNGNFATTSLSPGSGNSFSGNYATTAITYSFTGGNFKAQAQYHGTNVFPGTERGFSIINSSSNFTNGDANQAPFPGDPANEVAASNTWMYHNGNDLGGEILVWGQTVTGLTVGKTYRFRAYVSNVLNTGSGYAEPIIRIRTGGNAGLPDGTSVVGPVTLTIAATSNSSALNGWYRMEYAFTATATSMIFKITDAQTSTNGDDLALTAIGIDVCEKDTDGDGVADIQDIDADNDGILNTVESGGFNPFGDGDNDGILNYKDPTPGVSGLTWTDCNSDGINDFFDFDGDGIINALDLDSDNDGIPDIDETRDAKATDNNNDGMADGVDADGDGLMSSADANDAVSGGPGLTPQDLDRDGKPNYLDLDSDGDGITDLTEATGTYDSDGIANGTDADGDGMKGNYTNSTTVADNYNGFGGKGITLIDSDNDGKPDVYDIDSDNDGIPDNVEAQATCSYKLPTGTDTDGDGVDNAYDLASSSCNKTSAGLTPFDKDADGVPDYLDLDADNDGAPDLNEASGISGNTFVSNKNDTDGDGLYDFFDGLNILTATSNYHYNVTNSNMGPLGNFDGPVPTASKVQLVKSVPGDCSVNDRDWRECTILPVTLMEFKGNLNNSTAKLMWKVTNEINMNYYDVERSTDGVNYTKVNTVTATNSSVSTTVTNYSLNDDISMITGNVVYYRLKMMEKSGKAKNSNVVTFRLGKAKSGIVVNPNPAVSFFNLKVTTAKEAIATIRVMDLTGKVMIMQNNKVLPGTNAFLFNNLSNFSAGTYNVQVMVDGEMFNEKLIVTK